MSEGSRFWTRPTMWGPPVSNHVTHREIGDIPGCVPAVDVFIEREISQVQYYNDQQIPVYAKAIRKDGPWPSTLEPFKNRAAPTKFNRYLT